jgi:hypothetical protein
MIGRRAERERRLHARTSLGLKGTMAFDGSAPKRDCIIKNISERGACLDIGLLLDPPDRFSLMISASTLECTPKVRQVNKEHFFGNEKCPVASDEFSAVSSSSRQ